MAVVGVLGRPSESGGYEELRKETNRLGLPYVRIFPDMSGIQITKFASGRIFENPSNVRNFTFHQ